MATVVSSRITVKPGGSPLGDTSQVPSAPAVAIKQNGECANHCRSYASSDARSLAATRGAGRSEEHTSELQSLMRISYAVFCLTKKQKQQLQTGDINREK